eukprot:TRINITY_DN19222_c0_g1_i1.p1 TRINITY_DN19222_c0_g1~~TRINITY_DN19222_c0_g1_i1.p1  ORF type:complete len:916 (-),score=172.36 TRINITY_DN19222_c0_g1_i1:16-2721(-)
MDPSQEEEDNLNLRDILEGNKPPSMLPPKPRRPKTRAMSALPVGTAFSGPMTVMPGVPLPPVAPKTAATFFAKSSSIFQEAKMWEEAREQALEQTNTQQEEAVDQEILRASLLFLKLVPDDALPQAKLDELSREANCLQFPKLLGLILPLVPSGQLDFVYSVPCEGKALPAVLQSLLMIAETALSRNSCYNSATRLFTSVVERPGFAVRFAQVLQREVPIPRLLLKLLAEEKADHGTRQAIRQAILTTYRRFPPLREDLLHQLLRDLRSFGWGSTTCSTPVPDMLYILIPIISGLRAPIAPVHEPLLNDVLAPLHMPSFMLDELTIVLSTYHRPLSLCVRMFMRKLEPDRHFKLASNFLRRLLGCYQPYNSKHAVLLLNSVQEVLEEIDGEVFDSLHERVFKFLAESSASEQAAVSQRALQMWRSEAFVSLVRRKEIAVIHSMAGALIRDAQVHWNDGVNNMLALVIEAISNLSETSGETLRLCACQALVSNGVCSEPDAPALFEKYVAAVKAKQQKREAEENSRTELKRQRQEEWKRKTLPGDVNSQLKFVFGKELGTGAYSVVKYAKRIETDVPQSLWLEYAVKVMDKCHIEEQCYEEQVRQEIEVLKSLDHPAISRLFAHFEDAKHIYLVLEYCPQGDLFSAVFESGSVVSVEWCQFCLAELMCTLNYLGSRGIYYGDLKPENLLLTESGHLRLCDFGSCKTGTDLERLNEISAIALTEEQKSFVISKYSGTAEYLAPEILSADPVDPVADWWALGCLTYQLLAGHLPFLAENNTDLFAMILRREFTYPPCILAHPGLKEVIDGLLTVDPTKRWGFDQLREHPVFSGFDLTNIFNLSSPPVLSLKRSEEGIDPRWKRRKYSMIWNPIPNVTSNEQVQAHLTDSIAELTPEQMQWEHYE